MGQERSSDFSPILNCRLGQIPEMFTAWADDLNGVPDWERFVFCGNNIRISAEKAKVINDAREGAHTNYDVKIICMSDQTFNFFTNCQNRVRHNRDWQLADAKICETIFNHAKQCARTGAK